MLWTAAHFFQKGEQAKLFISLKFFHWHVFIWWKSLPNPRSLLLLHFHKCNSCEENEYS